MKFFWLLALLILHNSTAFAEQIRDNETFNEYRTAALNAFENFEVPTGYYPTAKARFEFSRLTEIASNNIVPFNLGNGCIVRTSFDGKSETFEARDIKGKCRPFDWTSKPYGMPPSLFSDLMFGLGFNAYPSRDIIIHEQKNIITVSGFVDCSKKVVFLYLYRFSENLTICNNMKTDFNFEKFIRDDGSIFFVPLFFEVKLLKPSQKDWSAKLRQYDVKMEFYTGPLSEFTEDELSTSRRVWSYAKSIKVDYQERVFIIYSAYTFAKQSVSGVVLKKNQ